MKKGKIMKNKYKAKLKIRHKQFLENLEKLYKKMDQDYPGWQDRKDADYIKQKLRDTAKLQQKNMAKKKTKLIRKKDFSGEWPFYADKIILVQTSKKMISCVIKNKTGMHEYALNGIAESALNLKLVHDAGKAIVGKSIAEFIYMGMKL